MANELAASLPATSESRTSATGLQPVNPFMVQIGEKLEKALLLKDYALSKNLDVSPEVIHSLNAAAQAKASNETISADDVDAAIKDLTALTYPATIDTVSNKEAQIAGARFLSVLRMTAVGALLVAIAATSVPFIYSMADGSSNVIAATFCAPLLALMLGFLGAMTYIYFNFLGVISEKAFNIADTEANVARLLLGMMLGWIFYIIFSHDDFATFVGSHTAGSAKANPIMLLLPFLVGFSTKLVVGVLNQAIRAAELTLGLENKGAQLAQRKTKPRTPASSPTDL